MKNVFPRVLCLILILAMASTMIPKDLFPSVSFAETLTGSSDALSEYYIKVGPAWINHHVDGTWDGLESLPSGASIQDDILVLENVEMDDYIESNGHLMITLIGENQMNMINGSDLTINGPGSLSLRADLSGFGIAMLGSITLNDCDITVSSENADNTEGSFWVGKGLTVKNSNLSLACPNAKAPTVYVASGYVLIEDSTVIIDSPQSRDFGFMAMADDMGDMLEGDLVVVRNSTLDITCGAVAIYERGNMLVENSHLSLVTTDENEAFTGFNSFDSSTQYRFVLRDSELYASHEIDDKMGIALGFYNAIVSMENSRVTTRGSISSAKVNAVNTTFDIGYIPVPDLGAAFEVREESTFEDCVLNIDAFESNGYRSEYGTGFI